MIHIQGQWENKGSNIKTEPSSQRKDHTRIQDLSDCRPEFILSVAVDFLASVSKDIAAIMAF